MGIRQLVPLALAGFAAACAQTAAESGRRVDPGSALAASSTTPDAGGKAVFDAVCATCHSVEAPAKLAPPMSHVARHYRDELDGDESAGTARLANWIRSPAADRSLLPAHAIERWGVMPPLALSEEQIDAVAGYVWSLGSGTMGGMGQGQSGMRQGQGGMGRGMMGHGAGATGQDTVQHRGHGGMGSGQGGMGQGMMMGTGQGGMAGSHGEMGHRQSGMGQGMMMGSGRGGMAGSHGEMGHRQSGIGQGMMMGTGQGGMGGSHGMMGRMCPMRSDTSSRSTG